MKFEDPTTIMAPRREAQHTQKSLFRLPSKKTLMLNTHTHKHIHTYRRCEIQYQVQRGNVGDTFTLVPSSLQTT